jgi:UDP-glucuronate 4-epimerase
MRILITGSSGFIGFHMAKLLLDKKNIVLGIDSMNSYYDLKLKKNRYNILKKYKRFSFSKTNLENRIRIQKIFNKFNPNIVIHLAAQAGVRYSLEKPHVYLNTNIIGTFNVIEASHMNKVEHLIMASSSSVYGANTKMPFTEIDKTETQLSIYAATKKATESMAHSYSNIYKIPITMLRFFSAYGPWGRPDMALFKFTKGILNNKSIDVYNNGRMYRDFTYIDDVVKAISLLIKKKPDIKHYGRYKNDTLSKVAPYRVLNVGNTQTVYLLDFIKEIEFQLNKKAIKNFLPLQIGDVTKAISNSNLLKNLTGYTPKTDYKKGVKKFIDWYKSYYK